MTLSNANKIRISILMALAIAEIVGLLHFYGQPKLIAFIILSLAGILLIIPLLWLEYIQRRGISYFSFLAGIWMSAALTAGWNEGGQFERLLTRPLIAGLPIIVAIAILRKLICPIDIDQQEEFLKAIRAEDNRLGRILKNTVGLVACIMLMGHMGSQRASVLWTIPLAIPIAWFTWRVIFHLFLGQRIGDEENVPVEISNSGGA
jgi:hypothetical protein